VAGRLPNQVIDQTYWLVHFGAGSLSAESLGSRASEVTMRHGLVAILAALTAPGWLFSACTTAPPDSVTLRLEGSVVSALDSTPLIGADVRLIGPAPDGFTIIAGTLTDQTGSFWLRATIATADCSQVQLLASAIGMDFGRALQPQLQCDPECQRFDFHLRPPAVTAHSVSEPTAGSCRNP
jgi:hypothetical protein